MKNTIKAIGKNAGKLVLAATLAAGLSTEAGEDKFAKEVARLSMLVKKKLKETGQNSLEIKDGNRKYLLDASDIITVPPESRDIGDTLSLHIVENTESEHTSTRFIDDEDPQDGDEFGKVDVMEKRSYDFKNDKQQSEHKYGGWRLRNPDIARKDPKPLSSEEKGIYRKAVERLLQLLENK